MVDIEVLPFFIALVYQKAHTQVSTVTHPLTSDAGKSTLLMSSSSNHPPQQNGNTKTSQRSGVKRQSKSAPFDFHDLQQGKFHELTCTS